MSEETIYDSNEVKQSLVNKGHNQNDGKNEVIPAVSSNKGKKKGLGAAGAAGIAGVAGVGLGVLTPKLVFPNSANDEDSEVVDEGGSSSFSGHLTGHDMDVATSVDDSMSFGEAFAAARQEVGPGGLFVWHGHTYGTYYGNEWNAMSPEDKEQYWADVFHTTAQLSHEAESQENNIEQGNNDNLSNEMNEVSEVNDSNEENGSITEPQPPTSPEEASSEPELLVIHEDDLVSSSDEDGDGSVDVVIATVNDNEVEDMIVDFDGDGQFDTLILDGDSENVVEINGLEIVPNDDSGLTHDEDLDSSVNDGCTIISDISDDNIIAENPDVDALASLTPDPDITIDNNMDMSDFA